MLFAGLPYLGAALLSLALSLVLIGLAGAQRRAVVLAGLVATPFWPFGMIFTDVYWHPSRLFGWPVGVEDAIYLFGLGSRAWFFAALAGGAAQAAAPRPVLAWGRLSAITGLAMLAWLLGWGLGLPPSAGAYWIPAGLLAAALLWRPALLPPALAGAAGCLLLGWAELRVWFWLWPDFAASWSPAAWSGRFVLGAPVGDLVWSALVGATHPVILLLALRPDPR